MKTSFRIVACIFAVLAFQTSKAQAPAIQWQKSLGGTYADDGYCAKQTRDGGYVVVGHTESFNGDCSSDGPWADTNSIEKMWIVKLTSTGSVQWQRQLQSTYTPNAQLLFPNDIAYSVMQTKDGGYIVAGGGGTTDPHAVTILKLDSLGNRIKFLSIGCDDGTSAYDIKETFDGGYIIAADLSSAAFDDSCGVAPHVPAFGPTDGSDWWVLKLNSDLSQQWQKTFGGTGDNGEDWLYAVQQTADSGFIFAGQAGSWNFDVPIGNSGDQGYSDAWLMKLDAAGNLSWTKTYGGTWYDGAESIEQTNDGGYIVGGYTQSTDGDLASQGGKIGSWVFKIDPIGNIQWQKVIDNSIPYNSGFAVQTTDGGYAVACNLFDATLGDSNYGLTKLNATGGVLWSKAYGGNYEEYTQSIQQTTDGGFILAGSSNSADGDVTGHHGAANDYTDIWLVKLAPANTGVNSIATQKIIKVFPNPTTTQINFSENANVQLFDLVGKKIAAARNVNHLDISAQPAGVYLLKFSNNEGQIIQHSTVIKQ